MVVLLGLLCGVALGFTGGGGAILAVPLLVYGLHTPIHQAVTISLFVVGFTALAGLLPRWRWQDLEGRVALTVSASGVLFAPAGALLARQFPPQLLLLSFASLMVFVSGVLFYKSLSMSVFGGTVSVGGHRKSAYGMGEKLRSSLAVLLVVGALTGALTGFFGIGGGFLIVPVLMLMLKLPTERAIATSLAIIFLVSLSGIATHIQQHAINWSMVLLFLSGSIVGVTLSTRVAKRLATKPLQQCVALLVGLAGVGMLVKVLSLVTP